MKKKLTYPLLILSFLVLAAFVVYRWTGKTKALALTDYPLKKRVGAAALLPEWASVQQSADQLYRQVREEPENVKSRIGLASLYIQEARATGDHNYYNTAALKYIEDALQMAPDHFDALALKATIQLSQHHFADALQTATQAQKINPYNAFIFGVMVDGHVELGHYAEAVKASDQMMAIRPDIRSYSRVAYLREIHGDLPGAIEAMQMAVDAGGAGDEPTSWARVQLARLYLTAGKLPEAAMHYTITQTDRPGYPYALEGLALVAMAKKDWAGAEQKLLQAIAASPDYALKEELAKLYLWRGEKAKATKLLREIVAELTSAGASAEQSTAHHAGKDLAMVYLLLGRVADAEKQVRQEYNSRPDNNDVNEALAWVLYHKGDLAGATTHMQKALRTGTKDPRYLIHAAAIYHKAGKPAEAKALLQEVLHTGLPVDLLLQQQVALIQGG